MILLWIRLAINMKRAEEKGFGFHLLSISTEKYETINGIHAFILSMVFLTQIKVVNKGGFVNFV